MQLLELTLGDPAQDIALDEALLLEAEASGTPHELLRLWELSHPAVVVGSSSRVEQEVDTAQATALGIPVIRRGSGGLAIVAGRGCLIYSLVLSYELRPALRSIDEAHRFVLESIVQALETVAPGARRRGISDLTLDDKKFSGNSLRCKRDHVLYHGTLLYDFPLQLIGRLLKMPHRQPEYRENRDHDAFITNLPASRDDLRRALITAFAADERRTAWPEELTGQLVEEKYSRREWNYRS